MEVNVEIATLKAHKFLDNGNDDFAGSKGCPTLRTECDKEEETSPVAPAEKLLRPVIYYNCGGEGHYRSNCMKSPRSRSQTQVEKGLFLTQVHK